jgi:hypothetical protein
VPTSVLLAVLAAAGLLALAPALVRRYDATERLVAERTLSTARVLDRRRRRRSVPGRHPVNPPRVLIVSLRSAAPPASSWIPRPVPVPRQARPAPVARPRRHASAVIRRRRVLAALLLLNIVELIGLFVVGPGFWVSFTVTAGALVWYVAHLRNRALRDRRRRRAEARYAAWLPARQVEVRQAHERRTATRREAARRLAAQREAVRRAITGQDGPGVREQPYSIRYTDRRSSDPRVAGY